MTARHATERNQDQAEEALRQSDERLRALVQNLSDVITVFDRDGTIRWSSPATERVFGRRPGEDDRAHPLNQIHPDDAERVEALLSSQLPRPGVGEPIEFRVRHADGSWRHVEAVVSNLLDDPAVGGIVFTTRDISERREAEEALRRSEARYRAIVEDQTELIARHRLDGTLTFVNDAACRYFGRSREEQLGDSFVPTVHPDDREAVARALEALSAERPVAAIENRVVLPTGEVRWQQWTNRAILDGEGRVVEYQAVGRDITEQKEAEAHLADQARVLEMIAKGRPLHETLDETCRIVQRRFPGALPVLLLIDDDGSSFRVEAAPGLPEGCGPALEEVGFVPPTSSFEARHRRLVTDGAAPGWAALHEVVAAHGLSVSWAAPILEASGERVLGALVVLTAEPRGPQPGEERLVAQAVHLASIAVERKAFETRLAHQAHHDPLTGLPNRVLFVEFLVHALARARRQLTSVAVLFLDCDRFKVVNDSLGHDAGDELLVQLARRLQTVLRPGDTVARFGGDEFVVLCEDLTAASARQQAVEVAERLLEAIQQPFVLNGDESFLSASIGIALSGGPDEGPEALLRDADVAMYRAKDRGKGRWELFDEAMRATALARLETETALHRAIDRGEFRVFYQPVVSLREGRCVGAEALIRWQHTARGLVAPHEFITLAEETGIIVPLGSWVLEEACREAARWCRDHRGPEGFVISVNLSARQLAQPDLPDQVARALGLAGADPRFLCLEITESALMDDVDTTIGAIQELKALGVRLSVDDFGTGYSSLGYLKRFPVDSVKVDRSFVDGLGTDPEDSAIVAAVVSLGRALGLTVVAEGVETEEQLSELMELGCDQAQGFFFAPPQPGIDMAALVARAPRWRLPEGAGRSFLSRSRRHAG